MEFTDAFTTRYDQGILVQLNFYLGYGEYMRCTWADGNIFKLELGSHFSTGQDMIKAQKDHYMDRLAITTKSN